MYVLAPPPFPLYPLDLTWILPWIVSSECMYVCDSITRPNFNEEDHSISSLAACGQSGYLFMKKIDIHVLHILLTMRELQIPMNLGDV